MKKFAQFGLLFFFFLSFLLNLVVSQETAFALLGIVGGFGGIWLIYLSVERLVSQEKNQICDFFLVAVLAGIAYLGQAWSPITATSALMAIMPFLVVEATLFSLSLGNATVEVLSKIKTKTVTWYNTTKAELQAMLQTWEPIAKPVAEFFYKLWQNVLCPTGITISKGSSKTKELLQKVVTKYREHRASKKAQNDVTVTSLETPVPQNGVKEEGGKVEEASKTPSAETKQQLEA